MCMCCAPTPCERIPHVKGMCKASTLFACCMLAVMCAGAGPSERTAASAVAAIDHLPKQDAIRMLALDCGGR